MTMKLRITDGKRSWWADKFAIDAHSGVLTLDGKTTVMIYDMANFKVDFCSPEQFQSLNTPAAMAAMGALNI